MTTRRNTWAVETNHVDLRRPVTSERPIRIAAQPQHITLDIRRTALLVIDMQNDFCHPDGWLAGIGVDIAGARRPIQVLEQLLPYARTSEIPVVWVNWGSRPDRANIPPGVLHVYDPAGAGTGIGTPSNAANSPVLQAGSWSSSIVDELAPGPGDVLVDKYRMSGFTDTPLDSILRNLRVDTVLLAGVNADQCVLATLMDAANLGYDVVMLSDAAGTTSPQFCMDATIYNVRQCFGFTATSSDLIAALDSL